ncbi:MAG: thioredoxin domain-containing protein [Methanomassiliicoccales archaeon]
MQEKRTNHLIGEKSLYLKHHVYNPVDWHPWSEQSLEKAKKSDLPLFISIGYSACHWCHVMARESFEDEMIASILNREYLPVKVDREERPDLDGIYMAACQMISGGGGWPLTIVATPDGKPFFAGTYFSRQGSPTSPGLLDILSSLALQWKLDKNRLIKIAEDISQSLKEFVAYREPADLNSDILHKALLQAEMNFDEVYGGFEIAPKFPVPHRLIFLLYYYNKFKNESAKNMSFLTLRRMGEGGIFDHVGYGFHRYSTDRKWHLPHFEKMLYDQALLAMAYSEAYSILKDKIFKKIALKTFSYVESNLTSPEGLFYSAEGSESEGIEGKFYTWTWDEIVDALGNNSEIFLEAFDIRKEGNFRDEATKRKTGSNILHLNRTLEELSNKYSLSENSIEEYIDNKIEKLLKARRKKVPPEVDDKILTDWNGLMIASLARSSILLKEENLLERAIRAANILSSKMSCNGRLYHRAVSDVIGINGFLDDYTNLIWGFVEIYKANEEDKYLDLALRLTENMIKHFWNEHSGGFFFTSDDSEFLIARRMDGYDGAIPSGNSIAAISLIELFKLTGKEDFRMYSSRTIKAFAADINADPLSHSQMLIAKMLLMDT